MTISPDELTPGQRRTAAARAARAAAALAKMADRLQAAGYVVFPPGRADLLNVVIDQYCATRQSGIRRDDVLRLLAGEGLDAVGARAGELEPVFSHAVR